MDGDLPLRGDETRKSSAKRGGLQDGKEVERSEWSSTGSCIFPFEGMSPGKYQPSVANCRMRRSE